MGVGCGGAGSGGKPRPDTRQAVKAYAASWPAAKKLKPAGVQGIGRRGAATGCGRGHWRRVSCILAGVAAISCRKAPGDRGGAVEQSRPPRLPLLSPCRLRASCCSAASASRARGIPPSRTVRLPITTAPPTRAPHESQKIGERLAANVFEAPIGKGCEKAGGRRVRLRPTGYAPAQWKQRALPKHRAVAKLGKRVP